VTALAGDPEQIDLPDSSIDVVTTNGVSNLVPDKQRALLEIFRVLHSLRLAARALS
jgi:ubiquinone/menaquinone biosynthesis C-methylase UbiE